VRDDEVVFGVYVANTSLYEPAGSSMAVSEQVPVALLVLFSTKV
jgi:hypothetical protein